MNPYHKSCWQWADIAKFAAKVTNEVKLEDVAEPELPPRRMELRCNKRELMLLAPEQVRQLRQRLIDLDAEARPKPPANERSFWDCALSIRFMKCLNRQMGHSSFTYPRSKPARNWLKMHGLRVTGNGVKKAIAE